MLEPRATDTPKRSAVIRIAAFTTGTAIVFATAPAQGAFIPPGLCATIQPDALAVHTALVRGAGGGATPAVIRVSQPIDASGEPWTTNGVIARTGIGVTGIAL